MPGPRRQERKPCIVATLAKSERGNGKESPVNHRIAVLILVVLTSTGCATRHYDRTSEGKSLNGTIVVEWQAPDEWLYTPKEGDPLTFVREDGTVIRPGKMFTDGGSIPRPLWALKNFSPWGYGPAFVVHDWLFHMQDCQLEGWSDWTLEEAALVMSEVMKTMMEDPTFNYGDKATVYLMYKAVKSDFARAAWTDRNCKEPPSITTESWQPTHRIEVSFGGS